MPATPNTISTPYSQPVVVSNGNNDPFLVFTDGYAGNVYVVDATTLSVVASQSVGASVVSPPTVVNGYIYLTTEVFPTGPAPVSNYLIALEGNF